MNKRVLRLTVLISFIVATMLAIGSVGAQDDETPLIAVLLPDSASSARWENDDRRFFEEAFEEAEVDYSIVNAEGDPQTQITQAEQAITNGADVLLFVNLDSGSGAAIIQIARDAGIPVIDYDRLTIEGDGADYYVSFNNAVVGQLQGEGLVAAVNEQYGEDLSEGDLGGDDLLDVAVLNGSPTDNNATLFKNGYDAVINPLFEDEDSGWNEVADQSVPGWDNQEALVIYEQMLTDAEGDINATIAANDGLAQAVITARQNQGLDPIPLTGQDATVGGIQNILAGLQSMTVYKAIRQEAGAAAELAIALANGDQEAADALVNETSTYESGGETVEIPSVLLDPIAVTADNVAETVIEDGFRTWEEICVGDFAQYCPEDAMSDMDAGTIVDVAVGAENLSTLVAAVQAAELAETLSGEGPFTVFAPTDEAFAAALEALDLTAEELLADTDTLTSILTYHVVSGEVTSDMLEAGEVETLNGATVEISLDDGVMVNDATVVTADVAASNGVVHIIDSVLLPPSDDE